MTVLELYHEWNSVHSFKVRMMLAEKGLAWVDHTVELLRFEHLRPEYLKLNPDGAVPMLVHDGNVVLESSVICEYLDDAFPEPPLRPAAPLERARMRVWLKFHDDVVHAAVHKASFQLFYRPYLVQLGRPAVEEQVRHHPKSEKARKFIEGATGELDYRVVRDSLVQFRSIAIRMEEGLAGGPWLAGESFSLADVALAPFLERVENLGMQFVWDDLARMRGWMERVKARPSFARSQAPQHYRFPAPPRETVEKARALGDDPSTPPGAADRRVSR